MYRRRFLRVAGAVPLTLVTAGCASDGEGSGPTETVVVNVGDGGGGGGGAAEPPATEDDAPEIEIEQTEFERIDANEFVVDGAVRNAGDQPFDHLELDVRLYEASGGEEGFFDEAERQREFEYMAPTETWTFRLRFDDVEIEDVSQYSITATATLATPTP